VSTQRPVKLHVKQEIIRRIVLKVRGSSNRDIRAKECVEFATNQDKEERGVFDKKYTNTKWQGSEKCQQ